MTLRAALRESALMSQAFGLRRPRIARIPRIRPARFPSAAHMAYLRGLLGVVSAIDGALKRHVVPELARLVEAHARSQPRTDSHVQRARRIAVIGAPRAGKTTEAKALGQLLGLPGHSSDALIAPGPPDASAAAAQLIAARS